MCLTGSAAVQPAGEVTKAQFYRLCLFFFYITGTFKSYFFQKTEQKKNQLKQ